MTGSNVKDVERPTLKPKPGYTKTVIQYQSNPEKDQQIARQRFILWRDSLNQVFPPTCPGFVSRDGTEPNTTSIG